MNARRKMLQKARKIAGIKTEAKRAAVDAELDNNQKALLEIASAGGIKAQLKAVKRLTC